MSAAVLRPASSVPNAGQYYQPEEVSDSKRTLIGRQLKGYCDATTIHGLVYVAEEKRPIFERVLWFLLFIAGLVLACYLCYPIFKKYRDEPVLTTVSTTSFPVWNIDFPAVTICNNNKVIASRVTAAVKKNPWKKNNVTITSLGYIAKAYLFFDEGLDHMTDDQRELLTEYNQHIPGLLRDVMPNCDDLLLACKWQGKVENCSNLFNIIRTDSGFCCSFNAKRQTENFNCTDGCEPINKANGSSPGSPSGDYAYDYLTVNYTNYGEYDDFEGITNASKAPAGRKKRSTSSSTVRKATKLRRSNSASSNLGLTVILDSGAYFYEQHQHYLSRAEYIGFQVLVHGPSEFPEVASKGLVVGPGTVSYIGVGALLTNSTDAVRSMNADRRGCLTKAEDEAVLQLYNYTVYTEYDRSSCLLECRARYIYQRCGCLPYYYPDFGRIWKKPTTCTAEGLQCLGNNTQAMNALFSDEFVNKDVSKFAEAPDCHCPKNCEEIHYTTEVSQAMYKNKGEFAGWLNKSSVLLKYDGIQAALKQQLGSRDLRKEALANVAILNVYFKELGVVMYSRNELYDIAGFIAAVGGIIGLFLGFSLLSGAEFIYWFTIRFFTDLWRARRKANRTDSNASSVRKVGGSALYGSKS